MAATFLAHIDQQLRYAHEQTIETDSPPISAQHRHACCRMGAACADAVLTQELAPTPFCRDGDEPTVRQTEGPFFKPRSPERSDLREPGAGGRRFELSGFVLTRSCRPLRGAVVDLWHADERGEYDNIGFRYRGHVITGPDGAFRFRTIVPALYSGRTRHYHVKVQAPGSRLLTTQLYFPNEPANLRDVYSSANC